MVMKNKENKTTINDILKEIENRKTSRGTPGVFADGLPASRPQQGGCEHGQDSANVSFPVGRYNGIRKYTCRVCGQVWTVDSTG